MGAVCVSYSHDIGTFKLQKIPPMSRSQLQPNSFPYNCHQNEYVNSSSNNAPAYYFLYFQYQQPCFHFRGRQQRHQRLHMPHESVDAMDQYISQYMA